MFMRHFNSGKPILSVTRGQLLVLYISVPRKQQGYTHVNSTSGVSLQ